MTPQARADLILACARILFVNGQATDQIVLIVERLCRSLGLRGMILPRWGELSLEADGEAGDGEQTCPACVTADPTGVDMDRVVSAMRMADAIAAGRQAPATAITALAVIAETPPAPTWLFALAAAAGAVALAVLFGLQHLPAAALIFASAGIGAVLRRAIARASSNAFIQPFGAALLAGIIGALAVRYQLSSSLRLVAVCPCMVLVPGPHVLNGALDLIEGRLHLGGARLLYAGLVTVAISTGLLLGLALFGVSLPVDEAGRSVPLWQDIIAAGIAVAAYSVFFSTPAAMLAWPIAVGVLAHALRWASLTVFGAGAATGAFIACLAVGLILTPVARRWHMPFAAIGFASVVSMMPGVFLFRMASGVVQFANGSDRSFALLSATLADGMTAATIVLAMSLGLIVPRLAIDRFSTAPR